MPATILDQLIKEPVETYEAHRKTHIGSYALHAFRKSPRLFQRMRLHPEKFPEKDYQAFGRAAHVYLLEGAAEFHRRYEVTLGKINPKTGEPYGKGTKAHKEFLAELEDQGKEIVHPSDYERLQVMIEHFREHPFLRRVLLHGEPELSARTEYLGVPCQCRLDWLNTEEGIVDLKSAWNLDAALRDAYRYGYLHQAAYYRRLVQYVTGETFPYYIAVVEKEEPFACAVFHIPAEDLDQLTVVNDEALERLAECLAQDEWPTGYEEPITLTIPK